MGAIECMNKFIPGWWCAFPATCCERDRRSREGGKRKNCPCETIGLDAFFFHRVSSLTEHSVEPSSLIGLFGREREEEFDSEGELIERVFDRLPLNTTTGGGPLSDFAAEHSRRERENDI